MKKFAAALFSLLAPLVFITAACGGESLIEQVKAASPAGYETKTGPAFEAAFDGPQWAENDGKVIFTGKVKEGSVFPPDEKGSFFDMQYSTIEETQMRGNADTLYNKYVKNFPKADMDKSGYDDKMLLDSEKYYNIMEILENKSTGSPVKAVIGISEDGKTAEILSIEAPQFYIHNQSVKDFCKFVFKK